MAHPTYLSPSTISNLTAECRAMLSNLTVEIIDEDLCQKISTDDTLFKSRYNYWQSYPDPKIRRINTDGIETVLFSDSDYVIDLAAGEVELSASIGTDVIRVDYYYAPLNDTILERLLSIAVKEVEVLIHRSIDDTNILRDYKAAVCKRLYTNVLKNLILEARNYFAVSVGDRTISKEQILDHLKTMWEANEADLLLEIKQLRDWNKTNRFE